MKCADINLRDPYVLVHGGKFYMYGSRAKNFAKKVGGFDVYVSDDLLEWSEPVECFDSVAYGLNRDANWAPEVHEYRGSFYMLATFTNENDRRGTFILKADDPMGPFVPHSEGAVTPLDWWSLDGTLYIDGEGAPHILFCHEHVQTVDGTICCCRLSDDLRRTVAKPTTLFAASSSPWVDAYSKNGHFVTDGPFLLRTKTGRLLMIWSSFIKDKYAVLAVRFDDGDPYGACTHLPPIFLEDGGHGMVFHKDGRPYLAIHQPNKKEQEHPVFLELEDLGDTIAVK